MPPKNFNGVPSGQPPHKLSDGEQVPSTTFDEGLLALQGQLRSYALYLTKDPTEAEDLIQDTLEKAHKNRGSFEPGTNLTAWTTTIMRNYFLTGRRRVANDQRRQPMLERTIQSGERIAPNQEIALELTQAMELMQSLSLEHQEVMRLVALEGNTYEEAAKILGVAVGTVKSRFSRAREMIRELAGDNT